MLAADPIKVQLVSSGASTFIAIAALVVSVLSVFITIYFRFGDRLQLKVSTICDHPLDSSGRLKESSNLVWLTVTNASRAATTHINALELELDNGDTMSWLDKSPDDSVFPLQLGPGESAKVSYPARHLPEALSSLGTAWARGKAISGHKTVVEKKVHYISEFRRANRKDQQG
ncbi:hypothetical protein [Glutamicibacter sp. AOP5-A2-18]|uniref:hypothetical protein n=1 Tax=Glutamicibacter sp. AOP5-A2-18 TaxID=3457656 RepID=UPI0040333361